MRLEAQESRRKILLAMNDLLQDTTYEGATRAHVP